MWARLLIYLTFAASADDPQCATPKSRKNDPSFNQSHLASATASPGSGGHAGGHSGEEFEMGSPNWNRTPASPVCIALEAGVRG